MAFLIVGLQAMRKAAYQVTQEDLRSHGSDYFVEKMYNNPLKRTFQILGTILIDRSEEEILREAARVKEIWEAKAARKKQSAALQTTGSTKDGIHSVSGPRQPSASPATPQKRNISDTSFGTRSTETTPTKLTKPESSIQNLQNTLVYDVLEALYHTDSIRVPWARGRKNLRLVYRPYVFPIDPFNSRSCETYFKCRLPDNKIDKLDNVTAIADGAFLIVTDKVNNSERSGIWSKQRACLLFDVRSPQFDDT